MRMVLVAWLAACSSDSSPPDVEPVAPHGCVRFGEGSAIPIAGGSDVGDFVVADFNGDGKPDLATEQATKPLGISIRLGLGNGTFAAPLPSFDPLAGKLAAGDLDHDGKLDLAVA